MAETKVGGERLQRVDHNQLLNIGINSHSAIDSHIANTNNPHNVTAAQVGKDTAQWNADRIKGKNVNDSAIGVAKSLVYNGTELVYDSRARIATGTYTGNGSSQTITVGFQPKYIEIVDVTGTVYRSIKIDTMPASDFMRTNTVIFLTDVVVYVTTGGITITSTGFTVGNQASINNSGDTYRWVAIG